jgi:hypothetical protein
VAWTISIIVMSLWFLGVTTPYTLHGHIHLLLAVAFAIAMIPIFLNKHPRGD